MAEDKMTIVDLRKAIAKQSHVEEATVAAFLNALFPTIVEGLKRDKQVRVNGLGTFKLQKVEPRKSVNVSTGEPIVIAGYQKLVFTPEQGVKERINAPLANRPLIDPLKKMDEQAEEIKVILAEIGKGEKTPSDSHVEETPSDSPLRGGEVEETPSETPVEETPSDSPLKEGEVEETPSESPFVVGAEEKKKQKPYRPWLVAIITILVFCLLLEGAYFFLQHKIEAWADQLNGKIETAEQNATPNEPLDEMTDSAVMDTTTALPTETAKEPDFYEQRDYSDTLAVEKVAEGSRLAQIARKYYQNKDCWVFIYDANRDKMKRPDNVVVGMRLVIPKLPDYIIDPKNEKSVAYIRKLQTEFGR